MTNPTATMAWCHEQALNLMGLLAEIAKTGDPGGSILAHANSTASDIAINLEMALARLLPSEAGTKEHGGLNGWCAFRASCLFHPVRC